MGAVHIEPFDAQWIREKDAIVKTIAIRLPFDSWLSSYVKGGLVFTHPDMAFDTDQSCQVEYGDADHWARHISGSNQLREFSTEVQLQVVDALVAYAKRMDTSFGRMYAVGLANALHEKAVQEAQAFVAVNC